MKRNGHVFRQEEELFRMIGGELDLLRSICDSVKWAGNLENILEQAGVRPILAPACNQMFNRN